MGLPLAHLWLITPDFCVVPLIHSWFSEQPVSLGAASVCPLLLTLPWASAAGTEIVS